MSRKKSSIANILKSKFTAVRKASKKALKRVRKPKFQFKLPSFPFWEKYGWLVSRIAVIAFFIGLNIALGKAFLSQNQLGIPYPVASLLLRYGIIPGEEVTLEKLTNPYQKEIVLTQADIIDAINTVRQENDLEPFTPNDKLATAAAILLTDLGKYDYDLQAEGELTPLADVLSEVNYNYAWVHNNALVGPLSAEAVVTGWMSDDTQAKAILTEEFTEIGLAVEIVETKFMGKAGAIVQLLAQPQTPVSVTISAPSEVRREQPKRLEEFTDQEVLDALNQYRSTHKLHALQLNNNLCTYAEKRVQDLVAFGSLDGHAGFQADFEADDPPVGIRDYNGSTIGENLASQYCINGTTGETIFAEHPTQLIEWCFDSSQKGHREAQLSQEYRDVCVRHGDNMYVVIFGDPN